MKARRAALYFRVSTEGQRPENQHKPLIEWCQENTYQIVATYQDVESGASNERKEFSRMLQDAELRKFDAIVCWSLDRFTREGIPQTFQYLQRLRDSAVDFVSLTEPHFRTSGPAGHLMIAITAWVADFERRRRQERVRAGLARATAAGVILGRRERRFETYELEEMQRRAAAGESLRKIAQAFNTSFSTVKRRLQNT